MSSTSSPRSKYANSGRRIALKRAALGLTQADLAKKLNIQRTSVTRYETGVVRPSDAMKARIARQLNTTVEALFYGDSFDA